MKGQEGNPGNSCDALECGGKRQRHAALGCTGGARRVFAVALAGPGPVTDPL